MKQRAWIKGFVGRFDETARVARHPKAMQAKALRHVVEPGWPGSNYSYRVISGDSGNRYWVKVNRATHRATCTCEHGYFTKRHPEHGKAGVCSHVLAVWRYINRVEFSRNVSAWATKEDLDRQHRSWRDLGDGVALTTRPMVA